MGWKNVKRPGLEEKMPTTASAIEERGGKVGASQIRGAKQQHKRNILPRGREKRQSREK